MIFSQFILIKSDESVQLKFHKLEFRFTCSNSSLPTVFQTQQPDVTFRSKGSLNRHRMCSEHFIQQNLTEN